MTTIVPPVFSRGWLLATLDSLGVQTKPEWQPGFGGIGFTHCNQAVKAGCDACGVPLPAKLANDLQVWLDSADGRQAGWVECSAQRAGEQAEKGIPTLSTLHEPGHGHITFVVPALDSPGLHIWQAGQRNFSNAPIRAAYTVEQLAQVRYFTRAD